MQEAKYSFNIKFNLGGYDCQFTVRSEDEPGITTLQKAPAILAELDKMGAVGERRWEKVRNGDNGAKEQQAKPQPKSDDDTRGKKARPPSKSKGLIIPEEAGVTGVLETLDDTPCQLCGVIGELQVIGFNRGGVYKQAAKCQACGKWQPEEK